MKKLILLVLSLTMLFSLCACGESGKSNEATIELTEENICEYLNISITYEKTDEKNILGYPVIEQTIEIYPVRDVSFENVQLLIFEKTKGWTPVSSELSNTFFEGEMNYTLAKITLPSEGEYTSTHKFEPELGINDLPRNTDSSKGWAYISLATVSDSFEDWFGSDVVKANEPCITGSVKE